jgi:hypothetical protein
MGLFGPRRSARPRLMRTQRECGFRRRPARGQQRIRAMNHACAASYPSPSEVEFIRLRHFRCPTRVNPSWVGEGGRERSERSGGDCLRLAQNPTPLASRNAQRAPLPTRGRVKRETLNASRTAISPILHTVRPPPRAARACPPRRCGLCRSPECGRRTKRWRDDAR